MSEIVFCLYARDWTGPQPGPPYGLGSRVYRVTSLRRNNHSLGPYSRTVPRALRWFYAGARVLVSEVPL